MVKDQLWSEGSNLGQSIGNSEIWTRRAQQPRGGINIFKVWTFLSALHWHWNCWREWLIVLVFGNPVFWSEFAQQSTIPVPRILLWCGGHFQSPLHHCKRDSLFLTHQRLNQVSTFALVRATVLRAFAHGRWVVGGGVEVTKESQIRAQQWLMGEIKLQNAFETLPYTVCWLFHFDNLSCQWPAVKGVA